MNKRLSILVLAAGAAGAMLLTACGQQAGSTTGAKDASADVNNVSSSDDSVDCGPFAVDETSTHTLLADQGAGGFVDCREAVDVLNEYLGLPAEQRDVSVETPVSNGWTCGIDDTGGISFHCVKGEVGNASEFTFHTVPADENELVYEVDCGEVEVDGDAHTLVAQRAEGGLISCSEAFNVIDELLQVPFEERTIPNTNIPLSNGWSCFLYTDSPMSIGCVKDEAGELGGFFRTEPVV